MRRWCLSGLASCALSLLLACGSAPRPSGAASGTVAAHAAGRSYGPRASAACRGTYSRRHIVADASALARALAQAQPGDRIELRPGRYVGTFEARGDGKPEAPIVVCGPSSAVIDGGGLDQGTALTLRGSHWVLEGFRVTHAQKGIVLEGASDNVLRDLYVHDIGHEGVHLRANSSRNVLEHLAVDATGLSVPGFGEGIYLGSAHDAWPRVMGAADMVDRSDENRVLGCRIGPNTAAENIDVKEGTRGGVIAGNLLLGGGLRGENYGDSWVDLKGNDYVVEENHGRGSPLDGFQVHVVLEGWGQGHVLRRNLAEVQGPGLGFRIDSRASGVIVRCDNQVRAAAEGFSNVECEP